MGTASTVIETTVDSKSAKNRTRNASNDGSKSLVAQDARSEDMVIQDKYGDLLIREHVVGKIAGLAIGEVPDVHELVPFDTTEALGALAARIAGNQKRNLGVHVEIGKTECAVDCRVIVRYGANLPEMAGAIRAIVSERVRAMTGLETREVNIEVADLYFAEARTSSEPSARQLK